MSLMICGVRMMEMMEFHGFIVLAGYGKLMGHPDVGIFEEAFQSLVLEELLIQGPGQRIDGLEKIDSRSILQATSIPTCE